MATPFNETPKWFIADFYLEAKLANLIAEDPKGNWTRASLVEAFTASGFENPYDHYLAYGDMEALSPNPLFNNTEYLADKAAAMGSTWTPEMVAKAIADADMTLMQHYEMFGSAEGLSPSSDFNQDKYYEAKLEQLQTAEPDKAWTLDTLKAAFAAAGLTPLDHYLEYAAVEGLDVHDYSDNGDPIPHPGNKIALTKGADTATPDATVEGFKTSGRDDAISAIAGSSTTGTLTAGDVIDGGAGVDTLTVDMQANYNFKSGSIKNVEKIVLNNKGGYTFDAKGVEAADLYTVNGGDKGMMIKNVDGTETGYSLTQTAGKFDVQIDDTALKGKADNVNITLNGVGTVSTDNAKDDSIVSLTVTGTKSGVVEGVTLLAAQGTDNLVILTKGHETVGVKGAGNVDVAVASGLKTFDASAATGEVIADLSKASPTLKTITGGAGDDSITVGVAALAGTVFTGGAGDDTLTFNVNPTAAAKTTISGFEKIVLEKGGELNGTNITDVAEIQVGASGGIITKLANTDLILSSEGTVITATSYDGKGNLTFQNVDSDGTVGAAKVNKLTANSVETLTITNGDTEGTANTLTVDSLEAKLATELTVNTGEFGVVISQADLRSVETIKVAGNNHFNFTDSGATTSNFSKLTEVNASELDGAFTFSLAAATTGLGKVDAPLSIIGSAVEDNTVTLTTVADHITFTGGSGKNLITGGNGADVITLAGSSNDTVVYAFGTALTGVAAEGNDTIIGFETGSDVIQFKAASGGFVGSVAGAAEFVEVGSGNVTITVGKVYEFDVAAGSGAVASNVVAALSGHITGVSGSAVFAIDDGSDTYLWAYTGGDSTLDSAEITLVGTLKDITGNDAFAVGDVMVLA